LTINQARIATHNEQFDFDTGIVRFYHRGGSREVMYLKLAQEGIGQP